MSFVLNGRTDMAISAATRDRVLEAAAQLGYHMNAAATQLALGKSHTIGLVLRQAPWQVASDALLPLTVRGIGDAAREGGYQVLVESLPPGQERAAYHRLLRSRRVDGIVVSGPREDDEELRHVLAEGFPIVLQGELPGVDVPSVDVDNVAGAEAAVGHLIQRGHRRIAIVTNAPLAYTSAAARLEGYRRALHGAAIEFDAALVAEGAFDAQSGFAAMDALLRRATFTAAFVASDVLALGAMGAIRAAGRRIPRDVSIVGFDDIPLAAHFDPPLTTVELPAYGLGEAAGNMLLSLIAGEPVAARTLLPTVLKVRRSVESRTVEPLATTV